jgi:hypothetical protein
VVKIEVGDKVLLYGGTLRRDTSWKLSSQCIGPCEVVELNKVTATISKRFKLIKGAREQVETFLLK